MKKVFLIIFFLVLAVLTVTAVHAQSQQPSPVTDDQVNAVAKQLYCPVCENIPLDVCPTQACAEWRDLIRTKLADGWSADQIKVYFAQQYGDRVLAQPPTRGLNWLVYILPWVAILAGAIIVFSAFWAWRRSARKAMPAIDGQMTLKSTPSPAGQSDNKDTERYIAQLEEELKKR